MPIISSFYGIKIRMHYGDHPPPHFHAVYGDEKAVFRIQDSAIIAGAFPRRAVELVTIWAEAHRNELYENWQRVERDETLLAIAPLE